MSKEHKLHLLNESEVHKMMRMFGYVTNGQAEDLALAVNIMQTTGAKAEIAYAIVEKMNNDGA